MMEKFRNRDLVKSKIYNVSERVCDFCGEPIPVHNTSTSSSAASIPGTILAAEPSEWYEQDPNEEILEVAIPGVSRARYHLECYIMKKWEERGWTTPNKNKRE